MKSTVGRWILLGLIVAVMPSVSSAGDLDDLEWIFGEWKRESRRGEVYESWQRLSDRTVEGDSWIVSSSDGTKHALESLLLVEMAGEVFYIPKVAENEYPVPFRRTSMEPGRVVFENPNHDFPQNLKTGFHTIQGISQELVVFRKIFKYFDGDFCDEAKSAFITDDNVANIGSGRPAGYVFNTGNTTIRKHRFQTHHHIFNTAVER